LIILIKIKLIESIPSNDLNKSLVIVPVFGRWISSVSLFLCPYPDTNIRSNAGNVVVSSVIAFLIVLIMWGIKGIGLFMMVLGFGILISLLIRVKFGESTNMTYRANIEITEIITLMFICILFSSTYHSI